MQEMSMFHFHKISNIFRNSLGHLGEGSSDLKMRRWEPRYKSLNDVLSIAWSPTQHLLKAESPRLINFYVQM